MVSAVINPREVLLFGTRYPIQGPIQRTMVTPFPAKVTQGDYQRDDEIVTSSWVMSDWTGGIGIENGVWPRDQDRFYDSTLETRYPRALTLRPRIVKMADIEGRVSHMQDFENRFYIAIGSNLFQWNEGEKEFTLFEEFSDDINDMLVFRNRLYVAFASGDEDVQYYDGDTWTAIAGKPFTLLIEWVSQLYGMELDGSLERSAQGTTSWAGVGEFVKPPGWTRKMLVFFDQFGTPSIHLITRDGVYGYDEEDEIFVPTPLTWPTSHPRIVDAGIWRGELYVLVGSTIYRYSGQTIQALGPDSDEGMPPEYRGDVVSFAAAHPFYYIGVQAPGELAEGEDTSEWVHPSLAPPIHPQVVGEISSRVSVLASPGTAMHPIFRDPEAGPHLGAIGISDSQGVYRIWISTSDTLYSMELPISLHNPLRNPHARFAQEGYLITPWFDSNWPEIDKVALSVKTTSDGINHAEGNEIDFFIQYDDEDDWTFVGSCSCQHTVGAFSGRDTFPIAVPEGGKKFRRVRFRIEMRRGADDSRAPVLRSIALSYTLAPDMLWGYQFTVDLSQDYNGLTTRQLLDQLEQAAEQKLAGAFYYRDDEQDRTVESRVKISRLQTAEHTGEDHRGRAIVSVMQLQADH